MNRKKKRDSKTTRKLVQQSKRDAEKQASRDRDAADLASGRKTREQLTVENDMFAGVESITLRRPNDLGRRTVQGVLIDESKWEGHDL
jgi:hypothetical protein